SSHSVRKKRVLQCSRKPDRISKVWIQLGETSRVRELCDTGIGCRIVRVRVRPRKEPEHDRQRRSSSSIPEESKRVTASGSTISCEIRLRKTKLTQETILEHVDFIEAVSA